MVTRIAINGFGRIGRCLLRALFESGRHHQLQVVAINELADPATIAHLTKYDSTHGRWPGQIDLSSDAGGHFLHVDGQPIQLLDEAFADRLPWRQLGIDLVLECTGQANHRQQGEKHLAAGANKVLFSHPADRAMDATVVFGINEHTLKAEHQIASAASCTTNGIVPVIEVLHQALGIEQGVITTIHSLMNDQPVIDAYHHTDLRKTRSASQSIIPVDTGLAQGIERILPHLAGRFEAQAMRVPTTNVSIMDLSVVVAQPTSRATVNQLLQQAANGNSHPQLTSILDYTDEPLASCDFIHDPHSAIVDASQTRVSGGRLVKVLCWFDNEWGYANRMLDVAHYWMQRLHRAPDTKRNGTENLGEDSGTKLAVTPDGATGQPTSPAPAILNRK